jgi:spore coat polysaccharide biosynthesis protein SpsF
MILAVLDARAACPNLAAALLAPILGEPMVWRQIERIRQARSVSKLEVLVGDRTADDKLAGYLLGRGVAVRRDGQADDPALFAASHVALIQADRPLTDPARIDEAVAFAQRTGAALVQAGGGLEVLTAAAFVSGEAGEPVRLAARHPDWQVRTPEDFTFVRAVFQRLYPDDPGFGSDEVMELVEGREAAAVAA